MEQTCRRCHNTLQVEASFCPSCGLPQLVYSGEAGQETAEQDRWSGAAQDAGAVSWKQALKACLIFAIPAGLLSSAISPVRSLGMLLAAMAAGWAVTLYSRMERPAWITLGAGVRIGLVTGLMAGWLAFAISGGVLFVERYAFHQGGAIDQEWRTRIETSQQMTQQWMTSVSASDEAQARAVRDQVQAFMLSAEGHAGIEAFGFAINTFFLLCFASGGGALGARWGVRRRRPEV